MKLVTQFCGLLAMTAGLATLVGASAPTLPPVQACHGCHVGATDYFSGGIDGAWSIYVAFTAGEGLCQSVSTGGCAAAACTGTAIFTVTGPPLTHYAIGFQTSGSPHYGRTPMTDANGNASYTITQGAPCGGTLVLDANGPQGQAWSYASLDCTLCSTN